MINYILSKLNMHGYGIYIFLSYFITFFLLFIYLLFLLYKRRIINNFVFENKSFKDSNGFKKNKS